MKKITIQRAYRITVIAAVVTTAFVVGVGLGGLKPIPDEPELVPKPIEIVDEHMEIGEKIYSTEIYDDGKVVVTTAQPYINQLSEHTIVITDLSLDDVPQEILDVMDVPE